MELKDVLGEIEADSANLVHGRLLEWALTPPLWHAEAVGGRPHHHAPIANPTSARAHDRDRDAGRDGARSDRCRCRHPGDRDGDPAGPGVITIRPDLKVLVAAQPVDFRKGMDALAGLVAERLSEAPYAGTIFVFRSKRTDRVKILAFDGTGLILA